MIITILIVIVILTLVPVLAKTFKEDLKVGATVLAIFGCLFFGGILLCMNCEPAMRAFEWIVDYRSDQ